MTAKPPEHPLALLFWSQIALAYGLPAALEIAAHVRDSASSPGRTVEIMSLCWPAAMVVLAASAVLADFGGIYACVLRGARRLPSVVVGTVYAVAAFVGLALWREGVRNATIAWADYVVHGTVMGVLVLLLAIVVEVFAVTFIACQAVALARRWRRLGRSAPKARAAAPSLPGSR